MTTGWIFDISLGENSIKLNSNVCMVITPLYDSLACNSDSEIMATRNVGRFDLARVLSLLQYYCWFEY